MVENQSLNAQEIIEARYHDLKGKTSGKTAGAIDEWILSMNCYRLLLSPATGRWFIHDRLHGTWEPTGFGTGEVVFSEKGTIPVSRLILPWTGRPDILVPDHGLAGQAREGPVCPGCGTGISEGSVFCRRCGVRLPPPGRGRFCGTCGKPTIPGTSFCRFCGNRIDT